VPGNRVDGFTATSRAVRAMSPSNRMACSADSNSGVITSSAPAANHCCTRSVAWRLASTASGTIAE